MLELNQNRPVPTRPGAWAHRLKSHVVGGLLLATLSAAPAARVELPSTGIIANGTTLNTSALQQAIDTCSASGGGTLHFPAGRYVTGTLQLKDNVTLHLDADAVLLGSTNAADYRNVDPFIDGSGSTMGYALIAGIGVRNVGLEGTGTIDGRGAEVKAAQTHYTIRPFLVRWVKCQNIAVSGVQLINSGAWTMNFFQSQQAVVSQVTIRSLGLVNNDGIDLDSSGQIRIADCHINSGDDALCLKATSPLPCHDITATNCELQTHCNAIKLGTESLGDFIHIRISHCQIHDTHLSGIALYSVDGAHLTDVKINDITMDRITVPISIRLGARLKVFRAGDQAKPAGLLRDVTIKNVRATGVTQIGMLINGLPGHPVEHLTLDNIQIELPGGGTAADAAVVLAEKPAAYPEMTMFGKVMPAYGIYLRHARGIMTTNVTLSILKPDARPPFVLIDAAGVDPTSFAQVVTTTPP